jgi:hypothetical protein
VEAPFYLNRLPAGVRRIVRTLGPQKAMHLLQARGGTRVKIPVHDDGVLSEIVGRDGVQLLQREFDAGVELDLPVAEKVVLELRNATIREQYQSGTSLQALALLHGLGRRQVQNIVQYTDRPEEQAEAERQGDLFV